MSTDRAEILATDFPNTAAARITINAPAHVIFDLVANPAAHQRFDGSGTIQRAISGPERLFLGAKFGMAMKIRRWRCERMVMRRVCGDPRNSRR